MSQTPVTSQRARTAARPRLTVTSRERLRFVGVVFFIVGAAITVQLSLGALLDRLLTP